MSAGLGVKTGRLVLLAALMLAGCSSNGEYWRDARSTSAAVAGFIAPGGALDPKPRTDPRFAALESAGVPALQVHGGTGAARLFRQLEVLEDGTVLWLAADGSGVALKDGLMVAARIDGTVLQGADLGELRALLAERRAGRADRFITWLTGDNATASRSYVCDVSDPVASEPGLDRVTERCTGPAGDFTNIYWLRNGAAEVARSRQYLAPGTGYLDFTKLPLR